MSNVLGPVDINSGVRGESPCFRCRTKGDKWPLSLFPHRTYELYRHRACRLSQVGEALEGGREKSRREVKLETRREKRKGQTESEWFAISLEMSQRGADCGIFKELWNKLLTLK